MGRVTAREAANLYFQAAVEAAGGSVPALLEKLEPELPELALSGLDREHRRTLLNRASKWKGQNPPPAEVLIAICRVLGLSLDEAAGVTELQPSMEERVMALEKDLAYLRAQLRVWIQDRGMPELPEVEEATGT